MVFRVFLLLGLVGVCCVVFVVLSSVCGCVGVSDCFMRVSGSRVLGVEWGIVFCWLVSGRGRFSLIGKWCFRFFVFGFLFLLFFVQGFLVYKVVAARSL